MTLAVTLLTLAGGPQTFDLRLRATGKPIVWRSADSLIARVTQVGAVTGIALGTGRILSWVDPTQVDTTPVVVTADGNAVARLVLTMSSTALSVGELPSTTTDLNAPRYSARRAALFTRR